jgi:hypothetical protein
MDPTPVSSLPFDLINTLSSLKYCSHWMPLNLTESELLSLYLFADKWICEPATDWALQRIEGLGLRASRMLGFAITLGVRRWVEPAIHQLFHIPMYSLSALERDEIGTDAFAVISNAQLLLSDQCMSRAACPPPMANVGFGMKGCRYYGILHDKS